MSDPVQPETVEVDVNPVTTEPTAPAVPPKPGGAIRALIAGLIVAVALGLTLLTAALSLMFMLGLFFYMLFGLLVGAVMFRFGARSRPMPRGRVVAITAVVALAAWSTSLAKEAHDFPDDFANKIMSDAKSGRVRLYIPPENGVAQVHNELHDFIVHHLAEVYPPGGMLGYFRYAAAGATIELDIPSQLRTLTIKPRVAPWVWWTRGLLALPLFFLTTYSVTAGLCRQATPAENRPKY